MMPTRTVQGLSRRLATLICPECKGAVDTRENGEWIGLDALGCPNCGDVWVKVPRELSSVAHEEVPQ